MTVRNPKLTFKKSMVWEKEITEFVASRMYGYTLNVPCGLSILGDIRIDIDPEANRTDAGDMNALQFPNCTFDSVISDPPWKLNFYQRMRPFFECIRVCKVGGTIIYNAPWIPRSKSVELQEIWVRQSAQFGNVSIISVFKKVTAEYD